MTVPAQPIPAAAPASTSTEVFAADFTAGTFNVAAWCEQDSPVPCNPDLPAGAIWTSFNRPGDQGLGCVGFGPNECWQIINGAFVTKDVLPGFPIVTARSFDHTKPADIQALMSAVCRDPACWAGIVWYDGERYWEAIYFSWVDDTHVVLSVWTPSAIVKISGPIPIGQQVLVDLIYDGACGWSAKIGGVAVPIAAPANYLCLPDDPHLAVFSGQELLDLYSLRVLQ